jgi:hypothetical protein
MDYVKPVDSAKNMLEVAAAKAALPISDFLIRGFLSGAILLAKGCCESGSRISCSCSCSCSKWQVFRQPLSQDSDERAAVNQFEGS